MSTSTEIKSEKAPLLLAVVLSVFLSAIGTIWVHLLPSSLANFYNLGRAMCAMQLTAAPFVVLIFAGLINKFLMKGKMSLTTLTYLYTISMSCSFFLGTWIPIGPFGDIVSARYTTPDWAVYIPEYMAPPREIAEQVLSGGVPIPWGAWMPSIITSWIAQVLFGWFFIATASIFRRLWIDVEKVPFPHAMAAHELLRRIPGEEKPRVLSLKSPFIIGIFLGIIFLFPILMGGLFPWFPDIYSWRVNTCGPGWYAVPGDSPLAAIVGFSSFMKNPLATAIAYLAPLSISFNAWFWHLIFMVLMQIAYAMGYYTGIETKGGCGRAWCSPNGTLDPPYNFQIISYGGGLMALTFVHMILNRRYLAETVKAAMGRLDAERMHEIEKDEAMSYRLAYILFIAWFVLLVVFFMIAGLGLAAAILMPITYFVIWMANTRLYGLAGVQAQGGNHGNVFYRLLLWPKAPDPVTQEFVQASYWSKRGIDGTECMGSGVIFSSFASYRMASLTGVNAKGIFKVMMISVLIAPLVITTVFLWMCYIYGATKFYVGSVVMGISQFYGYSNPDSWLVSPGKEPVLPYVLLGIVIVGALSFLHSRFVWFPFEPVGFIIGTSWISVLWGYWGPFLIAWILKTLTMRLGGSRAYEQYGAPIAAGFVLGYMVTVLVGGIMGITRFFYPY